MRLKLYAICTGLMMATAVPAMAQSTPIYNTNTGGTPYTNTNTGSTIYNNGTNVPPIALNQIIAGKNAPSYTYGGGGVKPYNGFNSNPLAGVTSIGSLTPEQATYLQNQQNQAYAAEQARLAQQAQQQQYGSANSSLYQGSNFSQLYSNPFGTQPEKTVPTKRRVVYKEANNPLVTPPRLFNPEQ